MKLCTHEVFQELIKKKIVDEEKKLGASGTNVSAWKLIRGSEIRELDVISSKPIFLFTIKKLTPIRTEKTPQPTFSYPSDLPGL